MIKVELEVCFNPTLEPDGCWGMDVRCLTDIRKGDRLLEVFPYDVENGQIKEILGAAFAVDLLVSRILSWEKDWDIVYAGMTAKIFVEGDASKISAQTFLKGLSSVVSK